MCSAELLAKDLSGQVVVVTGANSGAGHATAKQLVKQGATVVLACRDESKGTVAAKETGGVYMHLDLASLKSVRSFSAKFIADYERLDILVANAGMTATYSGDVERTEDGFEMMFGTNHLGHYLLVALLQALLQKSAARIVVLSSCAAAQMSFPGQEMAKIDFDDLDFHARIPSEGGAGYGQSKLANYLHAQELAKRVAGVTAVSVHPGWIDSPFFKAVPEDKLAGMRASGMMLSWTEGAQTTLHCCLADDIKSGAFYSQIGVYKDEAAKAGGWPMELPNPNATPEIAARLWDESAKLVGL